MTLKLFVFLSRICQWTIKLDCIYLDKMNIMYYKNICMSRNMHHYIYGLIVQMFIRYSKLLCFNKAHLQPIRVAINCSSSWCCFISLFRSFFVVFFLVFIFSFHPLFLHCDKSHFFHISFHQFRNIYLLPFLRLWISYRRLCFLLIRRSQENHMNKNYSYK